MLFYSKKTICIGLFTKLKYNFINYLNIVQFTHINQTTILNKHRTQLENRDESTNKTTIQYERIKTPCEASSPENKQILQCVLSSVWSSCCLHACCVLSHGPAFFVFPFQGLMYAVWCYMWRLLSLVYDDGRGSMKVCVCMFSCVIMSECFSSFSICQWIFTASLNTQHRNAYTEMISTSNKHIHINTFRIYTIPSVFVWSGLVQSLLVAASMGCLQSGLGYGVLC